MDGDAHAIAVEEAPASRAGWMQRLARPRLAAGLLLALVLILLAGRWIAERMATVATTDARVAADIIAVATDISGRVIEQHVSSGDRVGAGDVLYTIDDREARFRLAEYEADVARLAAEIERVALRAGFTDAMAGTQVAARTAGTTPAAAAVEAARANLDIAQREFARASDLFERGLITQAAYDIARNAHESARQALSRAEAERETAGADQRSAQVGRDEVKLIESELEVLRAALRQAEARVEGQKVVVDQHRIRSPIDGVVDELFYDVGEHSLQGFRMALLHDPDAVWVSANIKETELRHVRPGARAEIRPDAAPGRVIEGRVGRVGELTLAEASMMPNPNASGVFTKITQRVEVRIDLPEDIRGLTPGTMVRVKIDKARAGEAGE